MTAAVLLAEVSDDGFDAGDVWLLVLVLLAVLLIVTIARRL